MSERWMATSLLIAAALCAKQPWAAENPQQERMRQCNAQANSRDIGGEERADFITSCLRREERELNAQQQRMVDCAREATGLTGDRRHEFLSGCLRGDASVARRDDRRDNASTGASSAPNPQQRRMSDCNWEAGRKKLEGARRGEFMSDCLRD